MNAIWHRIMVGAIGLSGLGLAAGCVVAPPPPGPFPMVDFVDVQGYHHHGYYDDHHQWHGGYDDANHQHHDDPPDWHH